MKKLAVVGVLLILAGLCYAEKTTDAKCWQKCVDAGNSAGLCDDKCSYDQPKGRFHSVDFWRSQ